MDNRLDGSLKSQVTQALASGSKMPETDKASAWKTIAENSRELLQGQSRASLSLVDKILFSTKLKEKEQALKNDDQIQGYNDHDQDARIANLTLTTDVHENRELRNLQLMDLSQELLDSKDAFPEKLKEFEGLIAKNQPSIDQCKEILSQMQKASEEKNDSALHEAEKRLLKIFSDLPSDEKRAELTKALAAADIVAQVAALTPQPPTSAAIATLATSISANAKADITAVEADYLRIAVRIGLLQARKAEMTPSIQINVSPPVLDTNAPVHAPTNTTVAPKEKAKPATTAKRGTIENPIIDSEMSFEEAVKGTKAPQSVINNLRLVSVKYYGFDDQVHQGQLVIHKDLVSDIEGIFADVLQSKSPVCKVIPIVEYDWVDKKSIRAGNSSCFNYRNKEGEGVDTSELSNHSFGRCFDWNPKENPFLNKYNHGPREEYWRSDPKGKLFPGDPVVTAFQKRGWTWLGDPVQFKGKAKDYQHFQKLS